MRVNGQPRAFYSAPDPATNGNLEYAQCAGRQEPFEHIAGSVIQVEGAERRVIPWYTDALSSTAIGSPPSTNLELVATTGG